MNPADELPDADGYFGAYGGRFVPETLGPALEELEAAYGKARVDPSFQQELQQSLTTYAGRPTPLTFVPRLTAALGGARIYLKREDLNHTGAHKINNALGQILLARRMGKRRIIAETGAGQHGVATATVAARMGLDCVIYMGVEDICRQEVNVRRMHLLGAEVVAVKSGSCTLKDAINEAIRDWVTNVHDTFYLIGSAVGPHPYPLIVRDFQSVIGNEAREQITTVLGGLPVTVLACVGGGSNAIGMFRAFLTDESVRLVGVEAAGSGLASGKHAATLSAGSPGVLHGALTYLLQDERGQVRAAHSISAGLDYPAVGPEHGYLQDRGRVSYVSASDAEAVDAFRLLARTEGIIPALESAHALAHAVKIAPEMSPDQAFLICLSGRGDKDLQVAEEWSRSHGWAD